MRVFFGQAVDGVPMEHVIEIRAKVAKELARRNFSMLSSLTDSELAGGDPLPLSGSDPSQVVDRSLRLLRESDCALIDVSVGGRMYVGCIFEMVYAALWDKPVVVVTGETGLQSRPWLRYHARALCGTIDQAMLALDGIASEIPDAGRK